MSNMLDVTWESDNWKPDEDNPEEIKPVITSAVQRSRRWHKRGKLDLCVLLKPKETLFATTQQIYHNLN